MESVCYQCCECGQLFCNQDEANLHVSSCSKQPAAQELGESSQAVISISEEPPEQLLLDNQTPTEESTSQFHDMQSQFEIDPVEPAEEKSDAKSAFSWSKAATLLLIQLYEHHAFKYNSGTKKKQIWQMISKEITEKCHRVTPLQCENRWKTLMTSYRKTKFLNQLTGTHKTCNYFSELDTVVKNKRFVPRKRKTETSPHQVASRRDGELCAILKKMEERSEKRHQERMALQKEMMKSHKQFMQTILMMLKE